jgi:hypothetical protein
MSAIEKSAIENNGDVFFLRQGFWVLERLRNDFLGLLSQPFKLKNQLLKVAKSTFNDCLSTFKAALPALEAVISALKAKNVPKRCFFSL